MRDIDLTSRIFHIYRLGLAGVLLATYLLISDEFLELIHAPLIFLITLVSWSLAAAITSFSSYLSRQLYWLSCTNFLIDMVALSILGWASQGLNGGIFFLMLPSAALAGLMLPSRLALLVASIATLAIFIAQTALILDFRLPASTYFPSGVLGILLFLTTVAFLLLARRISVTEEKAAENRKIAASYLQLNETIIERMQTGVIVVDGQQIIRMANMAAKKMINADLTNTTFLDEHLSYLPKLFNNYEQWKKKPTETIAPITHSFSGISLQPAFTSIEGDAEEQTIIWLEDTRSIQQRAQQFKFQSLSKISSGLAHEIRNPLSAVQQANELLIQSPELSEPDRQLTAIIDRHCIRMNEIIEVIQQLSRKVEPSLEKIDLQSWIPKLLQEFKESHDTVGRINIEIEPSVYVYFDSRHLKQILSNLIDNGIRHSSLENKEPSQQLKVHVGDEQKLLYIDLMDTGPGIDPKDQRKIFDPFYTTVTGGSGLGLYLARELCVANYASINYLYQGKSQESGYFRITCPLEPPRS